MATDGIDPEDIEEEIELDDETEIGLDDETEIGLEDEEFEGDLDGSEDSEDDEPGTVVVRKAGDEDDEDDEMLAPDDVEADLDKILKDRLASEEVPAEDDDEPETEDRSAAEDALQPKRADEMLCPSCFLLVRRGAPSCPVGDDACPVFAG